MKWGYIWIVVFISPYIYLFGKIDELSFPPVNELISVLVQTCQQSALSGFFAVALGLLGGLGLLAWPENGKFRTLRSVITLPNFVPSLFITLSMIYLLESLWAFPFGMRGVVLIHFCMNVGLCSVVIEKLIRHRVGGMWELAKVEGCSPTRFIPAGVLGVLKHDLLSLFLFVFSVCASSFTVPLLAGDLRPLSLSVYMFNKLRLEGDWGQALVIAMLESVLLFVFYKQKLSSALTNQQNGQFAQVRELAIPRIAWIFMALSLFVLFGDVGGWYVGWTQLAADPLLLGKAFFASMNSLVMGLAAGLSVLIVFLIVSGFSLSPLTIRFFSLYNSPSPVFLGFVLLLILPASFPKLMVTSLALAFLFFPTIFRMYGRSLVVPLLRQVEVARVMGASRATILRQIIWPQIVERLCWLCGVAGFWAAGDFALSRVLIGEDKTLSLLIETLMGAYRLDMASVLSILMLAVGLLCFFIFQGVGRVISKKFV